MKLLFKNIDTKTNKGSVTLIADSLEDIWHLYNLISIGDDLRSSTIRRVTNETATGSTTKSSVHTTLTICVETTQLDMQAGVLSLKGKNIEENPHVKLGAYHTIDVELNRKFTINKQEWDSVSLGRIQEACDPAQNADVAAIIMQEGLANVCLVLASMTLVKAKIETSIPRKRKGFTSNYDKSLERFFERIVQAILTHINFDIVKAVIIASPGFTKDQFFSYMNEYAVKANNKVLSDNRNKFLLIHSSSGFKHSLNDILHDPSVMNRLNNTKALGEVQSLDAFYAMLKNDPSRAFYGIKHIEKANEADAIDNLLIVDSLFRSLNVNERKRYVHIVDRVRENNGQVRIFSSLHVSGEQLLQLTGIAAILRFPMPDIEDLVSSDSESEDDEFIPLQQSNIQLEPQTTLVENEDEEDLPVLAQAPKPVEKPIIEPVKQVIKETKVTTTTNIKSKKVDLKENKNRKDNKSATNKNYNKYDDDYYDEYDDYY